MSPVGQIGEAPAKLAMVASILADRVSVSVTDMLQSDAGLTSSDMTENVTPAAEVLEDAAVRINTLCI